MYRDTLKVGRYLIHIIMRRDSVGMYDECVQILQFN